jgi:hypothetical protein
LKGLALADPDWPFSTANKSGGRSRLAGLGSRGVTEHLKAAFAVGMAGVVAPKVRRGQGRRKCRFAFAVAGGLD